MFIHERFCCLTCLLSLSLTFLVRQHLKNNSEMESDVFGAICLSDWMLFCLGRHQLLNKCDGLSVLVVLGYFLTGNNTCKTQMICFAATLLDICVFARANARFFLFFFLTLCACVIGGCGDNLCSLLIATSVWHILHSAYAANMSKVFLNNRCVYIWAARAVGLDLICGICLYAAFFFLWSRKTNNNFLNLTLLFCD